MTRTVGAARDSDVYDLGFTASTYLADDDSLIVTHDWIFGFIEIALPVYDRNGPDVCSTVVHLSPDERARSRRCSEVAP